MSCGSDLDRNSLLFCCLLLISACMPASLLAWEPDGTPVSDWWGAEFNQQAAPDLGGGVFFVWDDTRPVLHADIYAARFDAWGHPLWALNGIPVCDDDSEQKEPVVAPDDAGGIYVAWLDERNGEWDIYAQRLDGAGNKLWADDGIPICTAEGDPEELKIIPDGTGGAILVWVDYRDMLSGNSNDIYAQRVGRAGGTVWTDDGAVVVAAASSQYTVSLCSDGAGGAIFTWADFRNHTMQNEWRHDIYARRLDAAGAGVWENTIISLIHVQHNPTIVPSGANGAIIIWHDYRNDTHADLYAQRVDAIGARLWDESGVSIVLTAYDQIHPRAVSDGSDGAIVCWTDYDDTDPDIRAQRIDPDGTLLWPSGGLGVPVCTDDASQGLVGITAAAGGAYFCWQDQRSGGYDIYTQRFDASGAALWTADGLAVCTQINDQQYPRLIHTSTGNAVICWHDRRDDAPGAIYAALVTPGGDFVAAFLREQMIELVDQAVAVRWRLSEPVAPHTFQIWRAVAPGSHFEPLASPELTGDGTRWSLTDRTCLPGATYSYRVCLGSAGSTDGEVLFETAPVTVPALRLCLESSRPNPFNPRTTIGYVLPARCGVRLEIFDAAGRFVTRLVDEQQGPGRCEAIWNGRDAAGQRASTGTYLVRLEAGESIRGRTITLVK